MAKRLDDIPTNDWPAHQVAEAEFRRRCLNGLPNHNCYLGFGSKWQVKLYLGGAQQVLGYSSNGAKAMRFADMALVFFEQYRKRNKRPLLDSDLNFSLAGARADLENIPEARAILIGWEAALLARKLISPRTVADYAAITERSVEQLRRDLHITWNSFHKLYRVIRARLVAVEQASLTLEMMDEYVSQGEKYNRSLESLLVEHVVASDPACASRAEANASREATVSAQSDIRSEAALMQHSNREQIEAGVLARAAEQAKDKCDYYGCIPENETL